MQKHLLTLLLRTLTFCRWCVDTIFRIETQTCLLAVLCSRAGRVKHKRRFFTGRVSPTSDEGKDLPQEKNRR